MNSTLNEYFRYNNSKEFVSDLLDRLVSTNYVDFVDHLNNLYRETQDLPYGAEIILWLTDCLELFSIKAKPILDFEFAKLAKELALYRISVQHKYLKEQNLHLFYTIGFYYSYELPELFIVGRNKTLCLSILLSFVKKSQELLHRGYVLDLDEKNTLSLPNGNQITTILKKVDKGIVNDIIKGFEWLYPQDSMYRDWSGYQIIYSNNSGEFYWDSKEMLSYHLPLFKQVSFSLA